MNARERQNWKEMMKKKHFVVGSALMTMMGERVVYMDKHTGPHTSILIRRSSHEKIENRKYRNVRET